jgi:hypothetical protein
LKEWNGLISTIALGRELIVAKDEIITTNAVAVSAFKLKKTPQKGRKAIMLKRILCIA